MTPGRELDALIAEKVEDGIRICRTCNEEKERFYLKKSTDGLGKLIFTDSDGKRWNSRECPDCFRERSKRIQRRKRMTPPNAT